MINGVNFGAISTDPTIKLQDATIAQPNNNSVAPTPSTPAAAAEVKGDKFEKAGSGKKVAIGFVATAAAALAGLAIAVKTNKLTKVDSADATKFMGKAKNIAADIGQKIVDIVDGGIAKAKKILTKAKGTVDGAVDETAKKAEGDIAKKTDEIVDKVIDDAATKAETVATKADVVAVEDVAKNAEGVIPEGTPPVA